MWAMILSLSSLPVWAMLLSLSLPVVSVGYDFVTVVTASG